MSRQRVPRSSFLQTPERIAIAGDWHANTDYAVEAITHAGRRNADVIVHLGDFGYNFKSTFLDQLDSTLEHENLVLGFVEGNHENFDWLLSQPVAQDGLRYLRERIVHLPRGFRWQWGRVHCVAVGGANSIDSFLRIPGRTWWPQERITEADAKSISAQGPADVMFCHDCPTGVLIPGLERDRRGFPDEAVRASDLNRAVLRSIVDHVQPARLWHGHFHHRYQSTLDGDGYQTLVDGLGRDTDTIDNNMVVVNVANVGRHHSTAHIGKDVTSAVGGERH